MIDGYGRFTISDERRGQSVIVERRIEDHIYITAKRPSLTSTTMINHEICLTDKQAWELVNYLEGVLPVDLPEK